MSDAAEAIDAELDAEPKFRYGFRYNFTDGTVWYDIAETREDMSEEEFCEALEEAAHSILHSGVTVTQDDGEVVVIPERMIASVAYRPTPYDEIGFNHG